MNISCENIKTWILDDALELLTPQQQAVLEQHLAQCDQCKQFCDAMRQQTASLESFGQAIEQQITAGQEKLLQTLNQNVLPQRKSEKPVRRPIMNNKLIKLAVAAAVVLALLAGVIYFSSSAGSAVVWAEVAQRIEQTHNYSYRMHMTMSGDMMTQMSPDAPDTQEMDGFVLASTEYGMRMDNNLMGKMQQRIYFLPEEHAMIILMTEMKKYMRMEFDEDYLKNQWEQTRDPRQTIDEFLKFDYTELPRETIDGVKVDGIEVTDPKFGGGMFKSFSARFWAEVRTGLPVRMEMDMEMESPQGSMVMNMVVDDYQWDIDVEPADFQPDIPDDYTEMANVKMPKMDTDGMIAGLQKYLDLTGKYPDEINPAALTGNLTEAMKAKAQAQKEAGETIEEMSEDEIIQKSMEDMMPVQAMVMFYMQLIQKDRDPAYYGDVEPGDADAVLVRWLTDSGDYQVVYGDLSTETLTADELTELEKP
ncbi:MAG: hypothetical protein JXD22_13125 [Sedimentisphaerales bacterium]|nr:hypothetical protein [Sedimentisphaerales bacterium]